jgi:hypothetical protein
MLPFHGVPIARRGRLSWLQFIERRPVMNDPGSLLPGHHSYEATLNFEFAVPTNQQKKVVSNRKRTVVVGRYKSRAHVTVTDVRWRCNQTGKPVTSGIIGRMHRCEEVHTLLCCTLSALIQLTLPLPKRESPTMCWARRRVSEAHRQRHGHAQ